MSDLAYEALAIMTGVAMWGWTMFLVERGKHNETRQEHLDAAKRRQEREQLEREHEEYKQQVAREREEMDRE